LAISIGVYDYVTGNPLSRRDPLGLDGEDCAAYYVDAKGRRVCVTASSVSSREDQAPDSGMGLGDAGINVLRSLTGMITSCVKACRETNIPFTDTPFCSTPPRPQMPGSLPRG